MKKSSRILYSSAVLFTLMLFAFGNTTQSTLLDKFVGHYSLGSSQQSYISSVISAGMFLALCLLLSGVIRLRRPLVLIIAAVLAAFFSLPSALCRRFIFCLSFTFL